MGRFSNAPLRLWAIAPLTLILGAATFRLTWEIPYSTSSSMAFLGLLIVSTVAGYFFLFRLLIWPDSTKDLKIWPVRIGITAIVTAALVAATIYLVQKIPDSVALVSKVVLGLSLALVAAGCFTLPFLGRPRLIERLKTRPVRIGVTAIITTALVTLTIHTIRFVPSPEAVLLQSKVMATLLLAALVSTYPLILRYIWHVWRAERNS